MRSYKLSKYLSPALRKEILSGKEVKLETQRKKLTIFFSDIRGFSELVEEMEAETLTALLNNYLTDMSDIALKFGGTIDKFMGDGMMVFFGDPSSRGAKDDCLACVSMAIAMKKHMKELQLRWASQGIQKPMEIRMGINTGFLHLWATSARKIAWITHCLAPRLIWPAVWSPRRNLEKY